MKEMPAITCSTGEVAKTYREYYDTCHWAIMRKRAMIIHGSCCKDCGSIEKINIHHLTYERIGHENPIFDLVPLCRKCHILEHKRFRSENMSKLVHDSAIEFLEEKWKEEDLEREAIAKRHAEKLHHTGYNLEGIIENFPYDSIYPAIKRQFGKKKALEIFHSKEFDDLMTARRDNDYDLQKERL